MSEPSMAHLPGSSVICIGIATLDYIYGVETLPTEGKKYRASALEVQGGGIAANAAVAIARLGGAASLLTRLGDDLTGDAVRTGLVREGVNVAASLAEAGRRTGAPRRAAIEINSLPGMLEAVRSGLGLAALPDYIGDQLDGLVQVLPEVKAPRIEAFFVYPEEMRHSKRVSVFRDFLVAELAAGAA